MNEGKRLEFEEHEDNAGKEFEPEVKEWETIEYKPFLTKKV